MINNSRQTVTARCRWSLALPEPLSGAAEATIATGQQERIPLALALPAALPAGKYELSMEVTFSSGQVQKDTFTIHVMPGPASPSLAEKIAIFDPHGQSSAMLAAMSIKPHAVEAGADLSDYDILVVGKGALTADSPGPDLGRVRDGLKVIVFEQTAEALEKRLGFRVAEYGLRRVFERLPDHPLLAGLDTENLRDWRGSATLLPPRLDYFTSQVYGGPAVKWCGLEVPRVWRCGNCGNVASVLIEKPARGDFLPILDGGYSLQYSPLLEYREGKGLVLFCQLDVTGRTERDPAAETLAGNLLQYVADWKPQASRNAFYAGGPAGLRHLLFAGIPVQTYQGGKLSPDACLVVASGSGRKLAENRAAIAELLAAGGHLLALGLDAEEANGFLPFKIGITEEEHIAAYFTPPGMDSLLRGIAPADVHNRDPRKLPLVSSGAAVLGNGVLAEARGSNVAFLQLPPYAVTGAQGAVPSFLVDSQDALEGKQSALVTLGMTGGGGVQFGQRVQITPQVGKTYTLAVFIKSVGGPVSAHLEVERAGSPWDRAVKGAMSRFRKTSGPTCTSPSNARSHSPKVGRPTSAARRTAGSSAPTCSGSTKGTMSHGKPPRGQPRRQRPPARRTCSPTTALRAGASRGSTTTTSNSTCGGPTAALRGPWRDSWPTWERARRRPSSAGSQCPSAASSPAPRSCATAISAGPLRLAPCPTSGSSHPVRARPPATASRSARVADGRCGSPWGPAARTRQTSCSLSKTCPLRTVNGIASR